ncbi:MAG: polysaccharide deacetylase family protein [Bacillota bacterium]|nr:polysaccharide deacetylase family protein [Bacillota bacterium]
MIRTRYTWAALLLAAALCLGVAAHLLAAVTLPVPPPLVVPPDEPPVVEPPVVVPPPIDLAVVRPNELGILPILMYHEVGPVESEWCRTPDNFRADLERLYGLGYRLVSLDDFIDNNIDVPPGLSPVILTFDDGTAGQLRYIKQPDGSYAIDPDCAVGILLDFRERHPDFGRAATFFVYYPIPFRQAGLVEAKLKHLVALGFEIGNHTYSHPYLSEAGAAEIEKELAMAAGRTAELVPGYQVRAFATPFGQLPPSGLRHLLMAGEHAGVTYKHELVLLAGGNPCLPPNHVSFEAQAAPRIRADQLRLDRWLDYLRDKPELRYISDGDPQTITFPAVILDSLNADSLGDRKLSVY